MSERRNSEQAARLDAIVDEFVSRYHSESPARAEDLVDAHPEIAEALAERLSAAERMLDAARAESGTGNTTAHTEIYNDTLRTSPIHQAYSPSMVIEGYDVIRMLHHGGQGIVYQAVQRSTDRTVALKLLLGGSSAPISSKKRFEREVALLARLEHPHIVTIFDSGITPDGILFYVMDYVNGRMLCDYVRQARLPSPNGSGVIPTHLSHSQLCPPACGDSSRSETLQHTRRPGWTSQTVGLRLGKASG